MTTPARRHGTIRTGIGGWVYPPWRETFFPAGLKHADELAYAASRLATIEINATFYRTQSPASFRRWAAETPDGFVFSVKAARGAAQRRDPQEAAPSIERFLHSGLAELGPKLGPLLWQLPPGRAFDADAMARTLDLLPDALDGLPLRHVIEARHASHAGPEALALLAERNVARAIVDRPVLDGEPPPQAAVTADFVYLRLQRTRDEEPDGYPPAELDAWAGRLRALGAGDAPPGQEMPVAAKRMPRDVFAYVISGAKHRAPAAAMALAARLPG